MRDVLRNKNKPGTRSATVSGDLRVFHRRLEILPLWAYYRRESKSKVTAGKVTNDPETGPNLGPAPPADVQKKDPNTPDLPKSIQAAEVELVHI